MAKNRAISRYKPFFRAGAMDLMAYKFHIFTWLIVTAFQVACTVFLWIAVYKNAGFDSVINGFSFKEMITYMVTVNIMSFVTFDSNSMNVIYDEIRDGTIAVSFIKPISYRLRFVASNLGSFFVKELLFGLPMFTAAYVIFVAIGFITIPSVAVFLGHLLLFLASQILATMLYDAFCYIFGVLCFYTMAGFGLDMLKDSVLSFFSGQLIPIAFFPPAIATVFGYLPFVGLAQTPVMILLMKYTLTEGLIAIMLSAGWLVVFEAIAALLFHVASKKVTVQGG